MAITLTPINASFASSLPIAVAATLRPSARPSVKCGRSRKETENIALEYDQGRSVYAFIHVRASLVQYVLFLSLSVDERGRRSGTASSCGQTLHIVAREWSIHSSGYILRDHTSECRLESYPFCVTSGAYVQLVWCFSALARALSSTLLL